MDASKLLIRVTGNRAIVLGNRINERSNKRFVLNLPKRLQTNPFGDDAEQYSDAVHSYLHKFGIVLPGVSIPTQILGANDDVGF